MKHKKQQYKRKIAISAVLCMMFTMIPVSASALSVSDISDHWAKNTIQSWVDKGLINGYTNGTMKPSNQREEVATIIMKISNLEADLLAANAYTDVAFIELEQRFNRADIYELI